MIFKNPLFFLLILVIPIIVYFSRKAKISYIRFSSKIFLNPIKPSLKALIRKHFYIIRLIVLVLLIFSLARPRSPLEGSKVESEGIDIILIIDVSGSMLAEDFTLKGARKNRLEVVKSVIKKFIKKRDSDRIGLVSFAANAYTVCPLTLDYEWILENIKRVKIGMIKDGTSIGTGIASALNRLRNSQAKSKVIILLTDGKNNIGALDPLAAAEAAKALGVKIYTIGAGTKGYAPYPARDFFGKTIYQRVKVDIDEETLGKIAEMTGARYFRATDTESLKKIYGQIDKLEKTEIEEKGYAKYRELFSIFLIAALILLLLEAVIGNTVFVKIP